MSVLFENPLPLKHRLGFHQGFRVWTVDFEERLVPSVAESRFRPGYRIEAECPKRREVPCWHPCLDYGYGCGIYAVKREDALPSFEYRRFASSADVIGAVSARVALWGSVIEHERGYRAQYAYPLEFLGIELEDPADPRHSRIRYFLEDAWQVPFRAPVQSS